MVTCHSASSGRGSRSHLRPQPSQTHSSAFRAGAGAPKSGSDLRRPSSRPAESGRRTTSPPHGASPKRTTSTCRMLAQEAAADDVQVVVAERVNLVLDDLDAAGG